MRPSYGVFGKQCMQCVIPGSLIVAGDVTVFRPKGIAFRTLVFCLVEFHVSQIRPVLSFLLLRWHTNSQEAWNVGGVPHAEDTLSTRMRPLQLVRGFFKAPKV